MSISVKCPNRDCDQQLSLTPDLAGKKGKCPKCGKTFQIPKNLGSGSGASKSQGVSKPAKDALAADDLAKYLVEDDGDDLFADDKVPTAEVVAETPRARPRRRRPARDEVEDYDSEPVAEATVIDDYEEPARPRRRRRRPDGDDYDDGPGDYDDDEDDYAPRSRQRKPSISKTRRWSLGSVGFLILAISACVVAGAFAMTMISEAFFQIAGAARKISLANAALTFAKISQIFWLLGVIGMITGYVFCIFIPNKRASLGLSIAALSLSVVNLVMGILFQLVPIFRVSSFAGYGGRGLLGSRSVLAGWVGGLARVEDEILSMFMEFGRYAELMLLALLMAAVAKVQKDRRHASDCMRIVWLLTGMAGAMLVMYIFMFVDVSQGDKWPVYVVRIFNWAGNALLTLTFVFLIMNLFFSRSSTS